MIKTIKNQPDWWGAAASTLCLIHCIITPFIFVAQACSTSCCQDSPWWWGAIDGGFLLIAWGAIRWAAVSTSITWMPRALYATWLALALVILNDRIGLVALGWLSYLPALLLVGLHLYNRRYCDCNKCESDSDEQQYTTEDQHAYQQ